FPTLCATLGYDTTTTLLLCDPPWAFATIVTFALTRSVNHFYRKSHLMGIRGAGRQSCELCFVVIKPLLMKRYLLYSETHRFLMPPLIAGYLLLWGWVDNTFAREPAKRAVAIALINTIGQIGNIVGPCYAWPSKWGGPTYRYSYAISIAAIGISTTMLGGMHLYLKHLNEQIDRNENVKG
ncbi:uncharacterized protein F5891DRAFT_922627, partial [Suillus fuscotomentosus]